MALSTLLTFPDPASYPVWAFDHMMAHRTAMGLLAPLDQYSVLPYILDPLQNIDTAASGWHLDHQQAHDDFTAAIHLTNPQILLDTNLQQPDGVPFWTFANQLEHYEAQNAVQSATDLTFPSW